MNKAIAMGQKLLRRFFKAKEGPMKKSEVQLVLKNIHIIVSTQQENRRKMRKNQLRKTDLNPARRKRAAESISNEHRESAAGDESAPEVASTEKIEKTEDHHQRSSSMAQSNAQNSTHSSIEKRANSLHTNFIAQNEKNSTQPSLETDSSLQKVHQNINSSSTADSFKQFSAINQLESAKSDRVQSAEQKAPMFNMTGSLSEILKSNALRNTSKEETASQKETESLPDSMKDSLEFDEKSKSLYTFEIKEQEKEEVQGNVPSYSFTLKE
ncbi:hypothetical protein NEMIN01_0760 [Nematocida minor]|uniref:uncharacterized protein n=1 Tax=Nematocida minor TaxID=1912983 RepID=UPI0022209751|nr:uncharacterized protein NEMIN01_0760 [Nematocida minor]KAI5189897.1 hypothetical protein NEMIN01_0760 [Nematocida minor]